VVDRFLKRNFYRKMIHYSINKIIDGIYLGNIDAANDFNLLKKHGISHILTVALGLQPVRALVSHAQKAKRSVNRTSNGRELRSWMGLPKTSKDILIQLSSKKS
jgi:hypothetical protein